MFAVLHWWIFQIWRFSWMLLRATFDPRAAICPPMYYIVHTTLLNQKYPYSQWADSGIWIYFSYLVLLSPVLLVTNKYSNNQKIQRQMNFSKHANNKYESSITNATSFSFLLYFMFAIEMKKKSKCPVSHIWKIALLVVVEMLTQLLKITILKYISPSFLKYWQEINLFLYLLQYTHP